MKARDLARILGAFPDAEVIRDCEIYDIAVQIKTDSVTGDIKYIIAYGEERKKQNDIQK